MFKREDIKIESSETDRQKERKKDECKKGRKV